MIDALLKNLAPHYCCSCGEIGLELCSRCFNHIASDTYSGCIACRKLASSGICKTHRLPYQRVWCVGEREGDLQRLIGLYKFKNLKSAYLPLASLLDAVLPILPDSTVIVPVPTAVPHIRERGYDHMKLIARQLSRQRKLKLNLALKRVTNTKQRDHSRRQRQAQARVAFQAKGSVASEPPYLLIDDVYTTGATLKYAAQELTRAGAKHIWVAVIARQTLD